MVPATSWVEAVICWVEAAICSAIAAASCACWRMAPTRSRSLVSIAKIVRVSGSLGARSGLVLHDGRLRSPSAIRTATVAATPVGARICFTSTRMTTCSISTATAAKISTPRSIAGAPPCQYSSPATTTVSTATTDSAVMWSL